ncbi:MAG: SUMF1/EgtB/PvdO family nonheme iron enzyme [Deltaproteobacteria bacterium]|nr:SUMF1/EgtB/PvdO family nonheme iron enzyme [Deltaproteobacteria bacterium]
MPGGTFLRRNDNTYPATVSSFALDKYEVTVGRFRAFVGAGGATTTKPPAVGAGSHPKIPNSGWQSGWSTFLPSTIAELEKSLDGGTWTPAAGANEQRPITNVSWFLAFAFCAWDRGRLPTYAEWTYASSGGSEQRLYPWSQPGSATDGDSTFAAYGCAVTPPGLACPPSYCSNNPAISPCPITGCAGTCVNPGCTGCDAVQDVAMVGRFPKGAGRWGHLDLGGNVQEWVLDVAIARKPNELPMPCVDCAAVPPAVIVGSGGNGTELLLQEGSWRSTAVSRLRNTENPNSLRPSDTADTVGFRCARD